MLIAYPGQSTPSLQIPEPLISIQNIRPSRTKLGLERQYMSLSASDRLPEQSLGFSAEDPALDHGFPTFQVPPVLLTEIHIHVVEWE